MDTLDFQSTGRRWRADLSRCFDLAITLEFDGPQPRFFADGPAHGAPLRAGAFTGRVADGASCNCNVHTLAPHCHGTHTECVGHVTADPVPLTRVTPVAPCLAALVTVQPERLANCAEPTGPDNAADDELVTRRALERAAAQWLASPWTALVLRTLPNDSSKRRRQYRGPCPAPYFTMDAMGWIVARGITSLVVDLPSLDRAEDGGRLAAHRQFWGLPPGSTNAREATRARGLVTELAFVPDHADDGLYLLDLQVPAFAADAAPSRPVIYPVTEQSQ